MLPAVQAALVGADVVAVAGQRTAEEQDSAGAGHAAPDNAEEHVGVGLLARVGAVDGVVEVRLGHPVGLLRLDLELEPPRPRHLVVVVRVGVHGVDAAMPQELCKGDLSRQTRTRTRTPNTCTHTPKTRNRQPHDPH